MFQIYHCGTLEIHSMQGTPLIRMVWRVSLIHRKLFVIRLCFTVGIFGQANIGGVISTSPIYIDILILWWEALRSVSRVMIGTSRQANIALMHWVKEGSIFISDLGGPRVSQIDWMFGQYGNIIREPPCTKQWAKNSVGRISATL